MDNAYFVSAEEGITLSALNGRKVLLATFLGSKHPPDDVRPSEDYWRLIGTNGTIVLEESQTSMARHQRGLRVLVQFPESIRGMGLVCHNEVPDSLWIFVSDLVIHPVD
ncbi:MULTISPECIES: hypothetical protein [Stenotrophomonas]|uniref:Uncharacterized protein n=2 Tax=Stenotrophomonas maltophilia TaxID=40324 RepID=A0AA41CJP0_STEMA|nr:MULTISPECIES: hypothetical protein [Stenotrophomonas]ASE51499.1 hypothetical protein CEQ03_01385 [Stenotrophomonas maltophilia]AWB78750.1 hypothetical protein B7H26_12740 [Stenotrophomonas maltophilia]KOO70859.1 hypothetical protein VL21_20370 [Stenotrophomonas maltophilia]MBH1586741.1 hypothetical protein [Stenotrophomonas maltophilia]MBH1791753.1 hypothetical protein [Stenotrophomonas maltophilia]